MKKQAGFTLIELVIVIVILGILGAVAVPRMLNLQGDAYGANLDSLQSSMESAATLANTKAILGGFDKTSAATKTVDTVENVKFAYGYPDASADGIIKLLDINASSAGDTAEYIYTTGDNIITFQPQARKSESDCKVEYSEPTEANTRPEISITKTGC